VVGVVEEWLLHRGQRDSDELAAPPADSRNGIDLHANDGTSHGRRRGDVNAHIAPVATT